MSLPLSADFGSYWWRVRSIWSSRVGWFPRALTGAKSLHRRGDLQTYIADRNSLPNELVSPYANRLYACVRAHCVTYQGREEWLLSETFHIQRDTLLNGVSHSADVIEATGATIRSCFYKERGSKQRLFIQFKSKSKDVGHIFKNKVYTNKKRRKTCLWNWQNAYRKRQKM